MTIKEEPVASLQGYSIIRITETGSNGQLVLETYALTHGPGRVIAEFAVMGDSIRELNRILFPLPGLPTSPARNSL